MHLLPLNDYHQRHAMAFGAVADTRVPLYYRSAEDEVRAAEQGPVVMDRSFLGLVRVSGKDGGDLLQRLTTNDLRHLQAGQGIVNLFTNAKGRIVDAVEILRREDEYWLIASPGHATTDAKWIAQYTFIEEVQTLEISDRFCVLSVFGKIPAGFAGLPTERLAPQTFCSVSVAGAEGCLHHTNGIAPEGFNLIVPRDAGEKVWEHLLRFAPAIGYAAYNTLRVHAGIPAIDAEISEQYNPHEVNLLPFVSFEKGCYIGQEVVARLDSYDKVQRRLVGLEFEREDVPPPPRPIWAGEQQIGVLTSSALLPSRRRIVGLGIVRRADAAAGGRVRVREQERVYDGVIVALPFTSP